MVQKQIQKTVLLVLPSVQAGGTENYVLRLLRYVGSEKFSWHIISLDPLRGDLHDAIESTGATIHYQSIGYGNPWKLFLFYRLLKSLRIETISTFTGNFGGLALTMARCAGIKTRIGWYRATEPAYKPSFLKTNYDRLANRLLWTNATQVLSNSNSALMRHQPSSNQRMPVRIIDNGVDASHFQIQHVTKEQAKKHLNIPSGTFTVCHVGRFAPAKNHETIFKTMAEVQKRYNKIHFIFCGKGTDSDAFLERLADHGVENIARGLGLRKDLLQVYRASDLLYFPSVTEGQPNVVIEAMICETPILASNIPAIREVLPPDYQEHLIDPLDWKLAAERIVSIARGEATLPKLCREYAILRFDPKKAFTTFVELL